MSDTRAKLLRELRRLIEKYEWKNEKRYDGIGDVSILLEWAVEQFDSMKGRLHEVQLREDLVDNACATLLEMLEAWEAKRKPRRQSGE